MTSLSNTVRTPGEKWADIGELRVRYLDWKGEGPPVVALHGLASSAHWYDRVAGYLSDGYRIDQLAK